jgi:perosamine synthetase
LILGAYPFFDDESIESIATEIKTMLRSGRLTDGPYAEAFEKKFAEYNQIKHAVAVSSGSSALDVALAYYKLEGAEVIVPTNTFISDPNAVLLAGGKLVFADMNPDTLGIDVEDVKRKVTKKTKGVIVVHIAGLVCPQIHELKEFCSEKELFCLKTARMHTAQARWPKSGNLRRRWLLLVLPYKSDDCLRRRHDNY